MIFVVNLNISHFVTLNYVKKKVSENIIIIDYQENYSSPGRTNRIFLIFVMFKLVQSLVFTNFFFIERIYLNNYMIFFF